MASTTEQPQLVRDTIYIRGEWVPVSGSGVLEVVNSTTEEFLSVKSLQL